MDAGFLNVVEIGQYFMTKDTAEVACREYTSQMQWPVVNTERLDQREHQKMGPYWKLQPVACKVNMELRSELCL